MMKKRYNQILVGLLALQVIVAVVVLWPRTAAGQAQPLFAGLKGTDIVALTITDDQSKTISLRQVDGQWGMADADNYPAQGDKVGPVLDKIAGLTTRTMVARTEASYDRLQVSPSNFVRRLDFETAAGAKYTIYMGSSPSYGTANFRLDGQKETYLADNLFSWDLGADPSSWLDMTYFQVPSTEVLTMTLQNANGTLSFSKDKDGNWSMAGLAAGEVLDQSKVKGLVSQASSISMMRPLGKEAKPEYGLDKPTAILTLQTVSTTVSLQVGVQDPTDKSSVIHSSSSPYYVRASEGTVLTLIDEKHHDLLQVPPTATPAPTASSAVLAPTVALTPTGILTTTGTPGPTTKP